MRSSLYHCKFVQLANLKKQQHYLKVEKYATKLFQNKPKDYKNPTHKLQKMLFEEKQRVIENQLFGVDLNPNSTQITKLRLWIELLKNSFYDENSKTLVTLPNIDINIKTGNSLISRFDLNGEIKINNIKHLRQAPINTVFSYSFSHTKIPRQNKPSHS